MTKNNAVITLKMGLVSGVAIQTLLCVAVAHAQVSATPPAPDTAGPSGTNQPAFGDIIVTAQRRSEILSRSPVAIAVVSGDTLQKAQILSQQDLQFAAPGLSVSTGTNTNEFSFALRGQSLDVFSYTRPGVLPYFNDVQISGTGASSAIYDLQSVQVLKGPQGTLFGRSSTGGAVLFKSQAPTDTFGGYLDASYGNYNAKKVEGAVNVPIMGDRVMARIAGYYSDRDGYQFNLYNNRREPGITKEGVRGSLTFRVGSNFQNDLVVDYYHADGGSTERVLSGIVPFTGGTVEPYLPIALLYSGTNTPTATATGIAVMQQFLPPGFASLAPAYYNGYFSSANHPSGGLAGFLASQQAVGPYVVDLDSPNSYRANNIIITNTSTLDLGTNTHVKNIFGYLDIKSNIGVDSDGTPFGILGTEGNNTARTHQRQVTEELQLQGTAFNKRITYVAGFYFSNEHTYYKIIQQELDLLFGGTSQTNASLLSTETYAGYAQGTYKLNDSGLAVTGGLRYTSENPSKFYPSVNSAYLGNPAPAGYAYQQSTNYSNLSWTLRLEDQISPDLLVYAANRRAYKAGGYNANLPFVGSAAVGGDAFGAERVTDVEVGAKFQGRVGDMPARLNIALYNIWDNNNQRSTYAVEPNGEPTALAVNVPKSETDGVELDGQIRPAHWLSLGGSFNYTNARFTDGNVVVFGNALNFDRVPEAPKYSGTVYADVTAPLSGNLTLSLHGDVYSQSISYDSPDSLNYAGTSINGYNIENFRLSVGDEKAGWTLTGGIKNAFNHVYYTGGFSIGTIFQLNSLAPGDPRLFYVQMHFKF